MKNPFQMIKEKQAIEELRKEQEQNQRKERLRQLEEEKNKKGFHIPNPGKAMRDNREIKQLRREIEAFEKAKQNRKNLLILTGVTIICMCLIAIMAIVENNSEKVEYSEDFSINVSIEETSSIEETKGEYIENQTGQESTESTEVDSTESIIVEEETLSDNLSISDLSVKTSTDYAHVDSDVVLLGNDEGVTITVTANKADVSENDLIITCDDLMVDLNIEDIDKKGSFTEFIIYATGNKPGTSEIIICSRYDIETLGENANVYILKVKKLDASEGRIVYVTTSGEKYHVSKKCAGNYSKKTTLYDVIAYEYEPCGKCAK